MDLSDPNIQYEIKAEAFHIMTGQMAPGKDPPSASYPQPYEIRKEMYDEFIKKNGEMIGVVILACKRIVD